MPNPGSGSKIHPQLKRYATTQRLFDSESEVRTTGILDNMNRIMIVMGTRPEIIKMAPVIDQLRKEKSVDLVVVHSGQHYDSEMSGCFFRELNLQPPDHLLNVGSGSHGRQCAALLRPLEKVMMLERPGLVLAEGDTNSAAMTSLASVKLGIPFGHVEAGLRSWDNTMPEEVNRKIADAGAELLFAPSEEAAINLLHEGAFPRRIHITGNTVVDACHRHLRLARAKSNILRKLEIDKRAPLVVITVHRAENVDSRVNLENIVGAITALSDLRIVLPIHPRTERMLRSFRLENRLREAPNVTVCPPLGYLDFLRLMDRSSLVVTDSGGVQEEALCLGKQCLTIRYNTERPETVRLGSNLVIGVQKRSIIHWIRHRLQDGHRTAPKRHRQNPYGDGRAGERIARIAVKMLRSGLHVSRSVFRPNRPPTYKLLKIPAELDNRRISEVQDKLPEEMIILVYDAKGKPHFPAPELILKRGWTARLLGPLVES